jgi:polyhydroxybutyrate depolymerase
MRPNFTGWVHEKFPAEYCRSAPDIHPAYGAVFTPNRTAPGSVLWMPIALFLKSGKMRNSKAGLSLFSILLLAALACGRSGPSTPAASDGLPAGELRREIQHAGLERSYILYVPAVLPRDRPVPLILVFHGGTGNANSAVRMSGFNALADQYEFLAAYPNGTNRLGDDFLLTWNAGGCCSYAQEQDIDDTGFVRAVVADVESLAAVDEKRIYAAGMSNGGMLSHRLACEAADLFAAVAPVAGTLNFPSCHPSRPVSVIAFHGTADEHVPYGGGYGPKSLVDADFASVEYSMEFWAAVDRCDPRPQTESFDDIRHDTWTGCGQSTAVELYTVVGGGHAWPGGPGGEADLEEASMTISATRLIWDFFAEHPKP